MRIPSFLLGVTLLLGPSAMPAAPTERPTPENLAAAQKDRDDAHVELETAKTALADIEALLNKVKNDLSYEYRALDEAVQRRNHEKEAELRATIRELKEARYGLEVKQDQARLVLSQREAVSEAADALHEVYQLQSAEGADPSRIRQWQKKHEKAVARARRLQREVEAVGQGAG